MNGRRAWRRWAKRMRWRVYRKFPSGAQSRRHPASNPFGVVRAVADVPPKPFAARSLVGMTSGARKRLYFSGRMTAFLFGTGEWTHQTEMEYAYSWQEQRAARPFLGERLRPCLIKGWPCKNCAPGSKRECYAVIYRKNPCDGSGVLPARKSRTT